MKTLSSKSTNIKLYIDILKRTANILVAAIFILGLTLAQGQQNSSPSSPANITSEEISNAFKIGEAAYEQKNYGVAEKYLQLAAEKGDSVAQTYLGVIYFKGLGVPKDYPKAINYFKQAAEQGIAIAQKYLGDIYITGIVVPHDYVKAAEYYHTSAVLANLPANAGLDYLYISGGEVPKDVIKAKEWYRMAAIQGNRLALALLQQEARQSRDQCVKSCNESYNTEDCINNWGTVDICRGKLFECGGVCYGQFSKL